MLRHLPVPRLAHRTITIRVDYLVRVISLLLLIGLLTSCVPEEDAVEGSGDNYLRIGDKQILWGVSTSSTVTFSESFSETPTVTTSSYQPGSSTSAIEAALKSLDKNGFTVFYTGSSFHWQAIGKYK